jgi:hypothetical protein
MEMQRSTRAAVLSVACALASSFLTPFHADASTIRHDRADAEYRALAAQFPSVGTNVGSHFCSGTLIGPGAVLTAAHCGAPTRVTVGGASYSVSNRIVHPDYTGNVLNGYDFQILELATPVSNVTPAPLYAGRDEVGQLVYSVGFGSSGNGLDGVTGSSGTKRAFTNVIDVTGSIYGNSNAEVLLMDFDNPDDPADNRFGTATATHLEGQVTGGDSGGGLFIEVDDIFYLAGVTSFSLDFPGDDGITGNYGDQSGYARVSGSLDFFMPYVPEPSTGLCTIGVLGVSLLRRRRPAA